MKDALHHKHSQHCIQKRTNYGAKYWDHCILNAKASDTERQDIESTFQWKLQKSVYVCECVCTACMGKWSETLETAQEMHVECKRSLPIVYYWNSTIYFITKGAQRHKRITTVAAVATRCVEWVDSREEKRREEREKKRRHTTKMRWGPNKSSCTSSSSALYEFYTFIWLDWIYFVTQSEFRLGTFCHFYSVSLSPSLFFSRSLSFTPTPFATFNWIMDAFEQ